MSHLALLMMLRRYRLLYLTVFVLTFILGGYFLMPSVLKYESSITFYHINENLESPTSFSQKGTKIINLNDPVKERLYQFTYSNQLLDHLIREFNLYEYYKIDSSGKYNYEKVLNKLSSNIVFTRNTTDLFTIHVKDKDRELAARMANALVAKLDDINKQYLIDKMQNSLSFYKDFLSESQDLSDQQNKMLQSYLDKLGNSSKTISGSDNSDSPVSDLEYSLYQTSNSIEQVNAQLLLAKGLYSKAILTKESNELPTLMVIKKAVPNLESKSIQVVVFAGLAAVVVCILLFLIMYFFHAYAEELQILFGKSPPEL